MAATIRDVAKRAGTSVSAASAVINGSGQSSIRVGAATRERIRTAAREVGYTPNWLARGLGRGRTDTIGLMLSSLQNPLFVHLLQSVEHLGRAAGYEVLFDAPRVGSQTARQDKRLRGWPVDGVLVWAQGNQNIASFLGHTAANLPVVYLGRTRQGDAENNVAFDVQSGARALAEHLIGDAGRRRLAYVSPYPPDQVPFREARLWAFEDACREAGVTLEFVTMPRREVSRQAGLETGLLLAARPASQRPDGLLCHNDVIAVGVYHGLRRAGVRVPHEIAVAGFDGIEEGQCLDLPLTTVELPVEPLCRAALDVLLPAIAAGAGNASQQILIPTRLLVGPTTMLV